MDHRIAICRNVDVNFQVIQRSALSRHSWYSNESTAAIIQKTTGISTTKLDVVDGKCTFVGVGKFTNLYIGFQLNSHTSLTGDVTHRGIVKGFHSSEIGRAHV